MNKLGVILVLLICISGGMFYFREQSVAPDPRKAIDAGVAEASASRNLAPQERDLLKLQLALVDFLARRGKPPESLGELVPTYFDSLPKNPATNAPYAYKREGMAYRLGEVVVPSAPGGAPVQVASTAQPSGGAEAGGTAAAGPKPVAAKTSAKGPASEEPFINPNTMPPDNFVYDPSGKRDPFLPFDLSMKKTIDAAAPLTSYNLSQLRVSAILISPTGAGGSTAIVEDTSGKGYTVKLGARIGDKNGTVVGIDPTALKVLESTRDFTGKEQTQVVEMKLEVKPADRKKVGRGK